LKSSSLLDYFEGRLISIEEIRNEKFYNILEKVEEQVVIFEGETEKDLETIAKSLCKIGFDKYVTGSSGIMEYLLYNWGYQKEKVLMVSGSCNKKNINQINDFIKEIKPTVYDYFIDEDKMEVIEGKEKECIVFRTIREEEQSKKNREDLDFIISEKVKKICLEEKIKKVALSGGDISIAFMERFQINRIELLYEVEPGIAYGKANEFYLVTKPGGFGSEKIYKKIYSFMKNCR